MKIYYSPFEYEAGKHKILKVWAEWGGLIQPKVTDCSILEIDEYFNRNLANLLFHNNQEEEGLPDRFYIDNDGNLRTSEGELVSINPNPHKEAYKLSQLYGLTHEQLDNFVDGLSTMADFREAFRKALHVILWLVKQTKLEE